MLYKLFTLFAFKPKTRFCKISSSSINLMELKLTQRDGIQYFMQPIVEQHVANIKNKFF